MKQKTKPTLIQVSQETWKELNREKLVSNDTFDSVIRRLLKFYREHFSEVTQW